MRPGTSTTLAFSLPAFSNWTAKPKTNRLLPRGWNRDGFPDYEMNPVPLPEGPLTHIDEVVYQLPAVAAHHEVCAKLYYQALPPYYLLDRAQPLVNRKPREAPESHRLLNLTTHLSFGDDTPGNAIAPIEDWKLLVDQAGACR